MLAEALLALATAFAPTSTPSPTPTPPSSPTPLAPAMVVDRLSLRLRGRAPSAAEVAAFTGVVAAHPERFADAYGALVDAYLSSAEFQAVAEQLHSVWWHLPPGESTRLAGYVVANDRPYFELLGRDYVYLDGARAPDYVQQGIQTDEPLPATPGDWRPVRLAASERRFRSVLSDLDFLDQFPDTATNHNRKRANQIFHTFLCETLAPTTPKASLHAFGDDPPPDDPHGSNPDCRGCHYRLDPLARFFDRWRPPYPNTARSWYDPAERAVGKLVLLDQGGVRHDHPGVGETDLAAILAAEPRVHRCVARQAWKFLLGPDVKLDEPTEGRLADALTARQSYKDLVRQVVLHPYFWSTEEAPPLKFADVKPTFDVCTQCHDGLGAYPFEPETVANAQRLRRIWLAVNHAPGVLPMPKAPIPALAVDTLASLRAWIAAGAVDDAAKPTLTDDQIQEVLRDDD